MITFSSPQDAMLAGSVLSDFFWCTFVGATHTRWVRLGWGILVGRDSRCMQIQFIR